jgi:hypothetical protein
MRPVAIDEQVVRGERPGSQSGVPGQDHPVLLERKADYLIVIQRPVIEDIGPQEPEPLCETAQHDIGDEFHIWQFAAETLRHGAKNKFLN